MKYRYKGDISVSKVKKCGVPNGQGKVTAYEEDGVTVSRTYKGAFVNGWMTGQGKTTKIGTPDDPGYIYEGDHVKGKAHGRGTWYYSDGTKYEGDHVKENAHGRGTWYRSDGTKEYVGDFQADEWHGQGTSYRHDGNIREDGAREDGTKEYEGQWKESCWHGHGTLFRPDGSTSPNGNWVNGGSEEYEWQEGEEMFWYEGDWDDDECLHGWGILYRPDRTDVEREGWWQNGEASDVPPPGYPV